jgi:hypothetical protein
MTFRTLPANEPATSGPTRRPVTPAGASGHRAVLLTGILLVLLLAAVAAFAPAVRGEEAAAREYQVKAAFILNFAKFIDWPAGSPADGGFTICTLGTDPFDEAFNSLKGKTIKGKPVTVRHLARVEDLRECQILFIGSSERKHLAGIVKVSRESRALTVSEVDGFCQAGGGINLVTEKSKVVFEINAKATQQAGLKVSAQLLKLARTVIE